MEKIELKHLAPYLPYGLKCQIPKHRIRYGQQEILTLNGLSLDVDGNVNPELLLTNDDLLFGTEIKWWKPVLRPLSDLTKEITINGETFVPLFSLLWSNYSNKKAPKFIKSRAKINIDNRDNWNIFYMRYLIDDEYSDKKYQLFEFMLSIPEPIRFWFGSDYTDEQEKLSFKKNQFPVTAEKGCHNYLNLFNKLFEYHMDVFGLIENGLAIDINTL